MEVKRKVMAMLPWVVLEPHHLRQRLGLKMMWCEILYAANSWHDGTRGRKNS
jgi:hypothetical protein